MGNKHLWTEKKIEHRIKNGYGSGFKENYIPWLKVQDVPSNGIVKRVRGKIVPRVYHFMSLLEFQYFTLLEWSDKVRDIREQFPLFHREDAQYIADLKGIKYPVYPQTKVPIMMTSDFAIQANDGLGNAFEVIRTVKPSKELHNKRVLEKLEIERVYWKKRKIDWGIVTEKDICPNKIFNLNFFRGAHFINRELPINDLILYLYDHLSKCDSQNIQSLLVNLDKKTNQSLGTFLTVFKFSLSHKLIEIDMSKKINLRELCCKEILIMKGDPILYVLQENGLRA